MVSESLPAAGLERKIQNYHGLSREEVSEVVKTGYVSRYKDSVGEEAQYINRILDVNQFYKGRMKKDGNDMARDILKGKYLAKDEKGPLHMWHRTAQALAGVESTPEKQEEWYYKFMQLLDDFSFIPGGRIMHGAGREDISVTLNNCYVASLRNDSVSAIYELITDEAKTYKKGGGVGHDLTTLRPRGSSITETGGESCGPVGFMDLASVNTNTIAQHGRRGANMQTLKDRHPGIFEFIDIKNDVQEVTEALKKLEAVGGPGAQEYIKAVRKHIEGRRKVKHSNVSVLVSDQLMEAVRTDGNFSLTFPDIEAYQSNPAAKKFYEENWRGDYGRWENSFKKAQQSGEISLELKPFREYQQVRARDLWDKIIRNAWNSGEPGVLFWDTVKKFHNLEYISPIESTNPCGEQPLPKNGCCNLGAINLAKFVDESGKFLIDAFEQTIESGVRFLDNVIDYNLSRHALEGQKENAMRDRRVGLGITGLGDMLIKMGIRYDSPQAIAKVEEVMQIFRNKSYDASIRLAEEKGVFPNFDWQGYSESEFVKQLPQNLKDRIQKVGIRNGTLSTCAPVGSGSLIAETTSGVEPVFSAVSERDVKDKNHDTDKKTYFVRHPLLEKMFGEVNVFPDFVVEAHEINPEFRVKMQATLQKYIDSSISSTVNLSADTPVEVVSQIYQLAHQYGLKGITVYKEGSREGVLRTVSKTNLENKLETPKLVQVPVKSHPVLEIKPHSTKYKIKRPENEDSLHVILTSDLYVDQEGKRAFFIPEEDFQVRAPLGSATTVSFAQSGMDRTEILRGPDPNYAEMVSRLQSASSNEEEGMGPRKIKSIEHAAGLAFEDYLLRNGVIGRDPVTNKLINLIKKKDLKKVDKTSPEYKAIIAQIKGDAQEEKQIVVTGTNGKLDSKFVCEKCQGTRYVMESGCHNPRCLDCGEYQGGSCG